ncbi:MAG: peptidase U32 family protein [Vulcanimicrobiota bacterium]
MSEYKIIAPVNKPSAAKVLMEVGADILYAGLKGWSLSPDNFEIGERDLINIIKWAKEKNKEVYLTFNCLYRSSELREVIKLIETFHRRGAAGMILSDPGLIQTIRRQNPNLQIIASVQHSASSSVDAEFLTDLGVNAVILPRNKIDLSPKSVKAMKDKGIELIVFAVADDSTNYDGRCNLSAFLYQQVENDPFGREKLYRGNINRSGYCHHPCMRVCSVGDKSDRFLKRGDLGVHRLVPQLTKMGIDKFIIQGRELPPRLIANTIYAFRNLLDNLDDQEKFEKNCEVMDDLIELKQVISMGHLTLIEKSKSGFWQFVKNNFEKPLDERTTDLWFMSEGFKNWIKKVREV